MKASNVSHLTVVGDLFVEAKATGWDDSRFRAAIAPLAGGGYRVGNLDHGLGSPGPLHTDKPDVFRGESTVASELRELGFDCVSLANTHSGDYGPEALSRTHQLLAGEGIQTMGVGASVDAAFASRITLVGGLRVAWIGALAEATPPAHTTRSPAEGEWGAAVIRGHAVTESQGAGELLHFKPDEQALTRLEGSIAQARASADVVAVMLHVHWPRDWKRPQKGYTIPYRAVDAGADLVFCHGSHRVEPVEAYGGRLIFHGLGNFFFQLPVEHPERLPARSLAPIERVWSNKELWHGLVVEVPLAVGRPPTEARILPVQNSRTPGRIGWPQVAKPAAAAEILRCLSPLESARTPLIVAADWPYSHVSIQAN